MIMICKVFFIHRMALNVVLVDIQKICKVFYIHCMALNVVLVDIQKICEIYCSPSIYILPFNVSTLGTKLKWLQFTTEHLLNREQVLLQTLTMLLLLAFDLRVNIPVDEMVPFLQESEMFVR